MLLSTIFEHLYYGELSQLNLGGPEDGGIQENNYGKVISFLNLGMTELYKRFSLREKELLIELDETITHYRIHSDYAENGGSLEPIKYIKDDPAAPFSNDLLLIMNVYDEWGEERPLNEWMDDNAVFTPETHVLQVPNPVQGDTLSVIYRAKPDLVPTTTTDPTSVDVDVPDQLSTALFAYIAYRAHLGLPEGETSKASASYARFNAICRDVEQRGMINKEGSRNDKLDDNGWS
jgi:hypothetical protein